MTAVRLTGLTTGWCLAVDRLVTRTGRLRIVRLPSVAALVEHPSRGTLLIDTGYAPRILQASRRLPYRAYRWATPMRVPPERSAVRLLAGRGIAASNVGTMVLTHLHADHVAGLLDFPNARILVPDAAWPDRSLRAISAVRRAILPDLLPPTLDARIERFALSDAPCPFELQTLGPTHDLLGDDSLIAVGLPGHALGQVGVLLTDESRGLALLVADALWDRRALDPGGEPSRLTHAVAHDAPAQFATIERLRAWHREHPDVAILPTHDARAWAEWEAQS